MRHDRHALSLVEMLIVITIIGLLSGLLLGTMSWARDIGRQVTCASKMRQIGVAFEAFALDHRGVYPPAQLRSGKTMWWLSPPTMTSGQAQTFISRYVGLSPYGDTWNTWDSYVTPYMDADHAKDKWGNSQALMTMFQCPSHPRMVKQDITGTWGPAAGLYANSECGVSYGINTAYLDTNACDTSFNAGGTGAYPEGRAGWPGFGVGIPGVNDNARYKRAIGSPSSTIQLAEHFGQPNWAQNRALWTEPPFARVPVDRDGNNLPVPSSFGAYTAGYPLTDKFIGHALLVNHRGRSNYLFVDGRVEALSPWETCSADPTLPNLWTGR